jgi:uncharacterized membrane protein HdeD (DUF308 family)
MIRDRKTATRDSAVTRWVGALLIVIGFLAGFAANAFSHWSCEFEWGTDCDMAPDALAPLFYLFAVPFIIAGIWMLFKPSRS